MTEVPTEFTTSQGMREHVGLIARTVMKTHKSQNTNTTQTHADKGTNARCDVQKPRADTQTYYNAKKTHAPQQNRWKT